MRFCFADLGPSGVLGKTLVLGVSGVFATPADLGVFVTPADLGVSKTADLGGVFATPADLGVFAIPADLGVFATAADLGVSTAAGLGVFTFWRVTIFEGVSDFGVWKKIRNLRSF